MKIDMRRIIKAQSINSQNKYNETNSILFLAKDKALVPTLQFYRQECGRLGCSQKFLNEVDRVIVKVQAFQILNETNVPD